MRPTLHRQTGRTTRMLMEAAKQADAGHCVYIAVTTLSQRRFFIEFAERSGFMRDVYNIGTIDSLGLDPFTLALPEHRIGMVFVDHDAIEKHYAEILTQLHRFDLGAEHG